MSWWDRCVRWWTAISTTNVVGPGAPMTPVRGLSAEDRAWVQGLAAVLEGAPRDASGVAVFTMSDELARSIAARLREVAG